MIAPHLVGFGARNETLDLDAETFGKCRGNLRNVFLKAFVDEIGILPSDKTEDDFCMCLGGKNSFRRVWSEKSSAPTDDGVCSHICVSRIEVHARR